MADMNGQQQEVVVEEGVHTYSAAEKYIKPQDPRLLAQLEWFQDQKLALMMHWGPYAQLGLVESWALSDKDGDWSRHDVDWTEDMEEFKKEYFDLNRSFNPVRFRPDQWAEFAAENGFRYFIFTTKHHDGFCMWDTAYTDYKITDESCPFHQHKNADIVKHVFEEFRKKGLGIAAYFSKADWHCPDYWDNSPGAGPSWRGPFYKPAENPEKWEAFCDFTKNQVLELVSGYGPLDILWFDAGWVCAQSGQDIRLGEIVDAARKIQPGILSADRTVGGPYENYVTPEQCVPQTPLGVPWESCITVGTQFSFKYEDSYKSAKELVHLLVDVVAKGGNLALNIGPQPDGRLPKPAVESVKGLGAWLKLHGEAIYKTRVCAPYKAGNIAFTKKGETVYAIYLLEEACLMTEILEIPYPGAVSSVELMGNAAPLVFEAAPGRISVSMPKNAAQVSEIALVFRLNP